jgi:hypothetical protein
MRRRVSNFIHNAHAEQGVHLHAAIDALNSSQTDDAEMAQACVDDEPPLQRGTGDAPSDASGARAGRGSVVRKPGQYRWSVHQARRASQAVASGRASVHRASVDGKSAGTSVASVQFQRDAAQRGLLGRRSLAAESGRARPLAELRSSLLSMLQPLLSFASPTLDKTLKDTNGLDESVLSESPTEALLAEQEIARNRYRLARNRWQLAVILLRNPVLQVLACASTMIAEQSPESHAERGGRLSAGLSWPRTRSDVLRSTRVRRSSISSSISSLASSARAAAASAASRDLAGAWGR